MKPRIGRQALADQQKADRLRDAQVETAMRDDAQAKALVEECRKWIPGLVVVKVRRLG